MTERDESQKLSVQINTVLFENLITIDVLLIKMYHLLHEYLKAPSSCPRYLHDNTAINPEWLHFLSYFSFWKKYDYKLVLSWNPPLRVSH